MHDPTLHTTRHDRATTRDREHILDRHQKRLVDITGRLGHVLVDLFHQLQHLRCRIRVALQSLQRRHRHDRHLITLEAVLGQQLTHLELHQLHDLFVIDHVGLVQRHHNARHTHLAGQQHMLTGLRHRPISRRHHQNRAVHLRGTRDHVLDVIRMARTIHMGVMTILGLILHMRNRNRDPTLLFLRSLVDRIKRRKIHVRILIRQHLGDRRGQRRLPMIDMTNRPNIQMRLRPLELLLRHGCDCSSCPSGLL